MLTSESISFISSGDVNSREICYNRSYLRQHLLDHEEGEFSPEKMQQLKKENLELRKRLNAVQVIANEENTI